MASVMLLYTAPATPPNSQTRHSALSSKAPASGNRGRDAPDCASTCQACWAGLIWSNLAWACMDYHGLLAGGTAYIKQRPVVSMTRCQQLQMQRLPSGLAGSSVRFGDQNKNHQHPLVGRSFKSEAGQPRKHKAPGDWMSDVISAISCRTSRYWCRLSDLLASSIDFRHFL